MVGRKSKKPRERSSPVPGDLLGHVRAVEDAILEVERHLLSAFSALGVDAAPRDRGGFMLYKKQLVKGASVGGFQQFSTEFITTRTDALDGNYEAPFLQIELAAPEKAAEFDKIALKSIDETCRASGQEVQVSRDAPMRDKVLALLEKLSPRIESGPTGWTASYKEVTIVCDGKLQDAGSLIDSLSALDGDFAERVEDIKRRNLDARRPGRGSF